MRVCNYSVVKERSMKDTTHSLLVSSIHGNLYEKEQLGGYVVGVNV